MRRPDQADAVDRSAPYEPRFPTLTALALLAVWILVLSLPMFAGKFLGNPHNDQLIAGYAFRLWGAEWWRALGHVPLWNPEIFGGLPFVGAMHGDIFYPTAWFRLFLPTAFVMNWEFPVHYVLAGLFVYLLLRQFKTTWTGAVVGGLAYQLSGVIASYVAPGHDGKLFVTTMLPLVFLGLVMGMRDRKLHGYALVAIGVGLALISPQAQCTYYMLVAAGIFALYLAFGEPDERRPRERWLPLGFALLAVGVGFGIGMIQILPFLHYLPYSPRALSMQGGYAAATSYAIPWAHVPEFFVNGFVGHTENGTYWGPNPIKLHSEYLGLPVIALALVGIGAKERRRMLYWLGGIGILFLLVGLGGDTPFYRLWWSVMPFMKKVRAPGIALYVVAFVLAVLAAFGVDRLSRGEKPKIGVPWIVTGAVVALLGAIGVFGSIAESLANGLANSGLVNPAQADNAVQAAQGQILAGAVGSGMALLLVGGAVWLFAKRKISAATFALLLPLLVGADMWRAARDFWLYEPMPKSSLYSLDAVTDVLTADSLTTPDHRYPGRVLDLGGYPGSMLMAFGVPQVLGYHGNELDSYDQLLGGQGRFNNIGSPRLWDLLAVRYIVVPKMQNQPDSLPGFHRTLADVTTSAGATVSLLEANRRPPYARLVPSAFKIGDDQAVQAIMNPLSKFDPDRIVLLGKESSIQPAKIDSLPPPSPARVNVTSWGPDHITLAIDPAAPRDGYLLVGENYYPSWHATVDGEEAQVLRGDVSFITVPVKAGAMTVRLTYDSPQYRTGKAITLIATGLAVLGLVLPIGLRRRRG